VQKVKFPPIFYTENGELIPPIPAVEEGNISNNSNHFYSNHKVIALENRKVLTVACPGNR
jgi:hypothetical protein